MSEYRTPKFKIMYLVHSLGVGGVERLVCEIARELKSRGDEPLICCIDHLGAWGKQLQEEGFKVF
jgi:hypothetical protein